MKCDPETAIRCLIVAGEPSGDLHAAALMRALQAQSARPMLFRGIGGDAMRAAGLELLHHTDETAVMGLWEVLRQARFFSRLLREMTAQIDQWRPDLLLTVDYPGFNLRLAARAHARGVPTVHYICPQVWAWHRGRIPHIARILDRLITVFPFEPALFDGTGLPVSFAGHPLVDRCAETLAEPPTPLPWGAARHIGLLPGSRRNEIIKLLPDLLAAAVRLDASLGDCGFIVPAASPAMRRLAEAVTARAPRRPARLAIIDGGARQVLRQAHAAAVASGTATLEAGLLRCPTVLVYRAAWPTYLIARCLVRGVKHFGLVNIVAGRMVMPELLQRDLTPAALAAQLARLLTDDTARRDMLAGMDAVRTALGGGDAATRAATAVLACLVAKAEKRNP